MNDSRLSESRAKACKTGCKNIEANAINHYPQNNLRDFSEDFDFMLWSWQDGPHSYMSPTFRRHVADMSPTLLRQHHHCCESIILPKLPPRDPSNHQAVHHFPEMNLRKLEWQQHVAWQCPVRYLSLLGQVLGLNRSRVRRN